MAKKKMCPQFGKSEDCPLKCPPGANASCEIVPPVPPKEKDVVVRAWAWLSLNGDIGAATVNACGSKVPCTITVKAEDMRKARK